MEEDKKLTDEQATIERQVSEYILSEKEEQDLQKLVKWCFNPEKNSVSKK